MERVQILGRSNWKARVESLGFGFHSTGDDIYWHEQACYHFTEREIRELEAATNEIENLCLAAVDHVVQHQRYAELNISEVAWPLIAASWQNREQPLYGRLDLSYNGTHPPKLLEYNADTPVCLIEASLVQKQWLQQVRPAAQQFNTIHEQLVAAWPTRCSGLIHLGCLTGFEEEFSTTCYLADTVMQAGLRSKVIPMDKIGWNGSAFIDEEQQVINTLFKLYPWNWLLSSAFSQLQQAQTRVLEPPWRMILNSKGVLVVLWELFPDHPNLLPAYFSSQPFKGDYVKKPLLGGKGESISFHNAEGFVSVASAEGQEKFMYQQAQCLPNFEGNHPVIGSWIIAGKSAGIGIREDDTLITQDNSRFVPHFFD